MKSIIVKTLILPAITLAIALSTCGVASAQDSGGMVCILDVAKVFKQNPAFVGQMDAIKAEADSLKEQINAEQEQIKTRAQGLKTMERGSADYNRLEAEIVQAQAALRTRAGQAENDLLNREARVYYQTYQQMQSIVESLAKEYNIALVLRYDSEEIDPSNRAEVIKGVNRSVVYSFKIDLTSRVSEQLNTRTAQGGNRQLK